MKWVDITGYPKASARRVPRTYRVELNGIKVILTRHIDYPGTWLLRCRELDLDMNLDTNNIETAKVIAGSHVGQALRFRIGLYQEALQMIEEGIQP